MALKTLKLGNKTKNKAGRVKLVLGNPKSTNEKYRFNVKVRIEQEGQEPITLLNPSLFFADKHEKAPDWIDEEVVVYQDDGQE
jgi:hypothetical protein